MTRLTSDQVNEAIQLYKSGLSYQQISPKFGVSAQAIRGLLSRRGLQARTLSKSKRKLDCNHQFFNEPLDEVRAYWIGFILADGTITEKSYGITKQIAVGLSIVDIGHIEKLKKALKSDHKIILSKLNGEVNIATLRISSSELSDGLQKYSIEPRKSAKHKFSYLIPPNLLKHYFRGYFDGNGGISRHKQSKWKISNCASEDFLNQFSLWLESKIGGHRASIKFSDGINRISWSGTHRCKEILAEMYDEANIFLDRKMALYQEICKDSKNSNRGSYGRK